jgi:hypothetical protein
MRALPIGVDGRAAVAAVLALAVDGVYLAVLSSQGDPKGSREALVTGSLAAAAGALLAPPALAPRLRTGLFAWAATTLGSWALLGMASIGLLLVPSAALAVVALGCALEPSPHGARLAAAAGCCGALAVVAAGLSLTS